MIEQTFKAALQHHQAGRLREAEQLYLQIVAEQPQHANAIHCLGAIALQTGRNEPATALFRRAIELRPRWPEAHHNLALALKNMGQLGEAITEFRAALALRPDYPSARFNLAEIYFNQGNALKDREALDDAIAAYRHAIALQPDDDQALCNLGIVLNNIEESEGAITAFRAAIALRPHHAPYHHNLGVALTETGQIREAVESLRRSLALKPDLVACHTALGNYLLLLGEFREGWDEFEWRWKTWYDSLRDQGIHQAVWDGEPLAGRTILFHGKLGYGDILQFMRYLPLVRERGGRVIVECLPRIVRLVSATYPDCQVISQGQQFPPFDVHCPLMGLPKRFAADLGNIPGTVPYLKADSVEARRWRDRLAQLPCRRNIGLCWAADLNNDISRVRSMPLSSMAPFASVAGVRFFNLKHGAGAEEAQSPPAGMEFIDWTGELADFADTALIQNLDLIITVDTATAHLAGAMGKPVWVLLPMVPEWRWMLGRWDTPWYPTMRLFRQNVRRDWDEVIARVTQALTAWVEEAAAATTNA